MTDNPRNLAVRRVPALKEVDRNGGAAQVVARNEVALAHHQQIAAHRDRIDADPADDKLI